MPVAGVKITINSPAYGAPVVLTAAGNFSTNGVVDSGPCSVQAWLEDGSGSELATSSNGTQFPVAPGWAWNFTIPAGNLLGQQVYLVIEAVAGTNGFSSLAIPILIPPRLPPMRRKPKPYSEK